MNIKDKKLIIRINKKEQNMIREIRNDYNINISSLVRKLLINTYKKLKKQGGCCI